MIGRIHLILSTVLIVNVANATLPNIVILYADDMGYGDLAVQNSASRIPTPNLDQLAREGTRFTDAHSSSGMCTPSRYALLTGCYHWRKFHKIVSSFEPSVFDVSRLTLPEMLRERGYQTACFGKWHLGWDWNALRRPGVVPPSEKVGYGAADFDWSRPIPDGPLAHGFDSYFGDDVPNFPPYTWIENDRVVEPPTSPYSPDPLPTEGNPEGRPGPMAKGWRQDRVMPTLTQRVVQWIESRRSQTSPFFLYFPWTSPHAPIVPAPEFRGSTNVGGYGDFLHQSDWCAGQVLQALDRCGFRENTIVIFSSDNGPERYAFDRTRYFGHRSMGPFRGVKRDLWEGGHRVPLIVRWPKVVPANRVCEGLFSQIDIMATLASVVGYDLPHDAAEDSFDQLSLWKGGKSGTRRSLVHNTHPDAYAIRRDDWVLIDAPTGTVTNAPVWFLRENGYVNDEPRQGLFQIRDDPGQRRNLAATRPELVADLQEELRSIRSNNSSRATQALPH